MRIVLHEDFQKYVDGRKEVWVDGGTVAECLQNAFNTYPQLLVFLLDNQGEEAKKTSLLLNKTDYLWETKDKDREVDALATLELGRDIPTGAGGVGKMIVGALLIVVAVAAFVMSGGTASWASLSLIAKGAIMMAGSMGMSLVMSGAAELIMGQPSLPGSGNNNETPTYTFSGIRNTTASGTPCAIVYGKHRVGGHLLNVYTDQLDKDNYLYAQLGLGEGEIAGIVNQDGSLTTAPTASSADIEVNRSKVTNFQAVELDFRSGTSDQTPMDWFNRIENSVSVGQLVATSGTVYPVDECEAVKVAISAPSLFYSSKKGLTTTSVKYRLEWRVRNTGGYTAVGEYTLSDKTKSEVVQEQEIRFPALGDYDVRVTRITDDHSGDLNYSDTLYLKSVNLLTFDKLAYPHTAMLGVKIKATEQLSGSMPTITTLIKGIKVAVPTFYNPDASPGQRYTGVWDGNLTTDVDPADKKWTDNPVWCFWDFLFNRRYGLGRYFKIDPRKIGIMKAQFYLMAKYCDDPLTGTDGSVKPRFSLNLVMDTHRAASEWMGVISATMRATLFYAEGMVGLDIDRPKPITSLFNMSNVDKGSWSEAGSSYKGIPNVYEVQWANPDKHYEIDTFRVESVDLQTDPYLEEIKKALDLRGISDYDQCLRLAKYALYAGRDNTRVASWKTGTDALSCMVGDVTGLQHDVPQWGWGGRIVSVSGLEVTLSGDVGFLASGSYSISISHKGQKPETVGILNPAVSAPPEEFNEEGLYVTRTINLTALPTFTPEHEDTYSIGETSYEVKPFKVISLKREEDEKVSVTAVEYTEELFQFVEDLTDDTPPEQHNYSLLADPENISVAGLTAQEKVYLAADGTVQTGIEVFFSVPTSTFWAGATIHYSVEGTSVWSSLPVNQRGYEFIPNLQELVTYRVVATSVYRDGTRQSIDAALAAPTRPTSTVTLLGKTAKPSDVTGFVVTQHTTDNNYLRCSWDPIQDVDRSHYELRRGTEWDTAEIIKTDIKETYYNNYFVLASGTYVFLVKAVDTTGNYSEEAAIYSLDVKVEPEDVTGFQARQAGDTVLLRWNRVSDTDLLGYEIREGVSWDTAAVLQSGVKDTFFSVQGVVNGTFKYFIRAQDIYENYSVNPVSSSITTINIPPRNVVMEFGENDATLEPCLSDGAWSGTHVDTTVNTNFLTLAQKNRYDTGLQYDTGLIYDDTLVGAGYYTTPLYDLGATVNCKVLVDYEVELGAGDFFSIEIATDSSDTMTAYWDSMVMWDRGDSWDTGIKTYSTFSGGYITTRYVQFRLRLFNNSGILSVKKFNTSYDVPDLTLRGSVTADSDGTAVTFTTPFVATPTISLTPIGAGVPRIASKSNTGFTVQVYDNSGTQVGGQVDWVATGY